MIKTNEPSKKLFSKAGFILIRTDEVSVEEIDGSSQVRKVEVLCFSINKPKKQKVEIIAEIGSNWRLGNKEQDFELAKTMIAMAKEAGADVAKFQMFTPGKLYVSNAGVSNYLSKSGFVEDIGSVLEKVAFPKEMVKDIAKVCEEYEIEFMASVFSEEDFYAIDPFVKRHKNASYEISHVRLLELFAKSGKPL